MSPTGRRAPRQLAGRSAAAAAIAAQLGQLRDVAAGLAQLADPARHESED